MVSRVVLAGRPNVGKSTLFNRLLGKKKALVSDIPGLTRDFREERISLHGKDFVLIDTAGVYESNTDHLSQTIEDNSLKIIHTSDLCLFVVDGKAGITNKDIEFSHYLRKAGVNVITIANKSESSIAKKNSYEFFELGFGQPINISAEHNVGIQELIEIILEKTFSEDSKADNSSDELSLAIVGKPNVGKSTLINALLGKERMITGDTAGITRDSIDIHWEWNEKKIKIIDTAGLRRRTKVNELSEKLAYLDSFKTIKFADMVVLLVDASEFIDKQDLRLADHIISEGRALLFVLNKIDLVKDKKDFEKRIKDSFSTNIVQLGGDNILKISSLNKTGIKILMNKIFDLYDEWTKRVPTSKLNDWLNDVVQNHQPPAKAGRRIKLRYITQSSARPPTFVIFTSSPEGIPDSYKKYLTNELRKSFGFKLSPLRLYFRKGNNPYI
ncbi:MAG: ribosome biogenesis GTPase Der [Hyphomicrobiales bacterium]